MSFISDDEDYENNNSEEDSYDDYEEEDIYKEEIGVYDRVGMPGEILGSIGGPEGIKESNIQEPLERFISITNGISRNLMGQGKQISERDINILIKKAYKLDKVEFKNPTAYILGYIASSGGQEIKEELFRYTVIEILPVMTEGSVLPPDILRYARLWMKL